MAVLVNALLDCQCHEACCHLLNVPWTQAAVTTVRVYQWPSTYLPTYLPSILPPSRVLSQNTWGEGTQNRRMWDTWHWLLPAKCNTVRCGWWGWVAGWVDGQRGRQRAIDRAGERERGRYRWGNGEREKEEVWLASHRVNQHYLV